AGPVDWAFNNDITTGKTATSFAPEDNVTRGESVTFLKRYNDNIVEPADEANAAAAAAAQADADANANDIDTAEADIASIQAQIAPLTNSTASFVSGNSAVAVSTPVVVQTLSLTAPADGLMIVTATGNVRASEAGTFFECSLGTTESLDFDHMVVTGPDGFAEWSTLAFTRGVAVADGEELTMNLVCGASGGSGAVWDSMMTMVFAPV
ncbi:MAG: hypothetical protein RIB98_18210, partial [Acidimicrobiales bacterium]